MGTQKSGWLEWLSRWRKQGQKRPEAEVREFAATVAILPPTSRTDADAAMAQPAPEPASSPTAKSWAEEDAHSEIMDSRPLHGPPRDFALIALEVTDPGRAAASSAVDASVQARPTLGQVGRYALKTPLGLGGMGQVHEAWDPLLSRAVAVKTLQFDLPQPLRESLDGMILNEARAAAGLSHAYIVTVFDAGLSERGVYIAMERLHGRDLRHALSTGWLPSPRLAAVLVRRVADALAYAHGRGVVHCDIKPANIFLVGRDRPKVLDFGIARIAHETAVPALDGTVAGSPYYQAPEQVRGGNVDSRTDLYALGTVLYELLTGRRAFNGDSVQQIQDAVLNDPPPLAHHLRPDVPIELSEIAAKAMSREPRDRYISAIEMSLVLRRWAEEQAQGRAERKRAGTVIDAQPAAGRRDTPGVASASTPPLSQKRRLGWLWLAAALAFVSLSALLIARMPSSPEQGAAAEPAAADAAAATASAPISGLDQNPASKRVKEGELQRAPDAKASNDPAEVPSNPAARDDNSTQAQAAQPAARQPQATAARANSAATARAALTAASAPAQVLLGNVQLAISPWGRVEVNGKPVGTAPPLTRLNLPEGTHTITVRNEDFPPFVATVQVSAERSTALRHRFGP